VARVCVPSRNYDFFIDTLGKGMRKPQIDETMSFSNYHLITLEE
jgi:hypothetical protein